MPFTAKQNKVWRAIEHGWNPPGKKFAGVSRAEATKMAHEGVKGSSLDEHIGKTIKHIRRKHHIARKLAK